MDAEDAMPAPITEPDAGGGGEEQPEFTEAP